MARQATLELLADASKLKSTLSEASGHADSFGSGMGKALAIVGGTAAFTKFGMDSVAAFTESAQAQSKLELALKNSNHTIGVHADDFAKLNSQLAKHTLADDDVIASTEAQMVTFGASKEQIQSMIPTVLDFSAKMGVSAPEAADLFDKASLGSVKALKTLGIEGYKPTGDKAVDLANIQGLLKDKVAGAAQAQLDAAGPGAKIKKSMDELQESVGKLLVPALEAAAGILSKLIDWFTNLSDPVKIAIGVVGGLAVAVWAITAAQGAWTAITGALATAQAVLNAVMAMNPIVLVVLAVAGLVAVLVLAYQHCETFRNIVQAAFGVVVTVVQGVFNWVKNNWPLLLAILTGPIGVAVLLIVKNWDTITAAVQAVWDFIVSAWDAVVGFLTGIPGRIWGAMQTMWDAVTGAATAVKDWVVARWDDVVSFLTGIPAAVWGALSTLWDREVAGITAIKDWVVTKFTEAVDWLKGLPGLVWGAVSTVWDKWQTLVTGAKDWVSTEFEKVIGWLGGLPNRIGQVTAGMWDGIKDAFRSVINTVIGWWNGLHFAMPKIHIPGTPFDVGGFDFGTPHIPTLDTGGIVSSPTLAFLAANSRPEAVVPLDSLNGVGGGGTTVIQLVVDGKVLTEIVHNGLLAQKRRSGGLGLT